MISTSSKTSVKTTKQNLDLWVIAGIVDINGNESVHPIISYKTNEGENQMIVTLIFINKLNLTGLLIESSGDKLMKPSSVQLFTKRIKYKDIGATSPLETLNLGHNCGKVLSLKPNNFKNLESISVIIVKLAFIYKQRW